MSRNTKIVVGIIVGIVSVCCVIAIAAFVILPRMASDFVDSVDDPDAAAEVADSIVDYDLPAGYDEQGAMNLFGFRMAFITGRNEQSVIMLAEFPDALAGDEDQMQQQMREAFANQSGTQSANLEFIRSEDITINGADATLATYEGTDEQGNSIRQMIGVFKTKSGGPGMLMIIGPRDSWDEDGISRFLDSLE